MCGCHGFFLHSHSAYCVRDSRGNMLRRLRRCGMCTRYNWVCIHMSVTLSVTCCLPWHLLSPSEDDWCTTESRGTFSHVNCTAPGSPCLSSNAKSLHTVCARVCELKKQQGKVGTQACKLKHWYNIPLLVKTGKWIERNGSSDTEGKGLMGQSSLGFTAAGQSHRHQPLVRISPYFLLFW